MEKIIGRETEKAILRDVVESGNPEFVAVFGRRRIGKTFLIKNFFDNKFDFYMTGSFNASKEDQLEYFQMQLEKYSGQSQPKPRSWLRAFRQLQDYLESLNKDRIIVFFDELPWLDTPKSRFFTALELFWNGWADSHPEVKFIVCGSATTWMTNKLIGDKGGLHNRVTRQLYLAPFTLHEAELMLREKGVTWNRHQILECYMVMGGTPFYLQKIDKSLSVPQNIDRLFFHHTGALRSEYDFLFRSLFKESQIYRRIVELIADKSAGLSREEIVNHLKISDSGRVTEVLDNLIKCDFLREFNSFAKKSRGKLYQLSDLFTLFYIKQVKGMQTVDSDYWATRIDSPAHRAWSGYAFEQVCLHHIPQIKKALGISGIQTNVFSWSLAKNGKREAQIDLVIDRRDQVINLCEMKYSINPYVITPTYMAHLREREELFRQNVKTRSAINLTFITMYGLHQNAQSFEVQNVLTADALFSGNLPE